MSIFILWQFSYCGNLNYHQHNFNPSPFEVATVKKGIIVEKSAKEGFFLLNFPKLNLFYPGVDVVTEPMIIDVSKRIM